MDKEINLANLTPEEQDAVAKILVDISHGSTSIYDTVINYDYDEMPVDIDTFIEDDEYLGKITKNGKTIYPYWRNKLREIFADSSHNYHEIVLTGAIGLGKTTIAITGMAYILHNLLCLKNPQEYYNLQGNSKIVFTFFNTTMDLSYGVAYKKLQSMLLESPWFLKHGKVYGRDEKNKWYMPNKGIEFRVGSQEHHALGQDVFCVVGSTIVSTENGDYPIEDLVGKTIRAWSLDPNGNPVLSDPCTVKLTRYVTKTIKIQLEDGSIIECTPDHRLMLSDGSYIEAQYITEGMEIVDSSISSQ